MCDRSMGILTDIRLLTELNRLMSENHRFSTSLNRQAAFITYFVVVLTESLSSMISSEGLDKIIRSVIIFLYCSGKKKNSLWFNKQWCQSGLWSKPEFTIFWFCWGFHHFLVPPWGFPDHQPLYVTWTDHTELTLTINTWQSFNKLFTVSSSKQQFQHSFLSFYCINMCLGKHINYIKK